MVMRAQMGGMILLACIATVFMITISTTHVTLEKTAMEDYNELNFLSEPYLTALSRLTYDPGCGSVEIYELMAYAAADGKSTFSYCGHDVDLNDVIDPIHEKFQSEFAASNYYLFIENSTGSAFFKSPRSASNLVNITVLTQMPLPLPNEKVSRAVLVRAGGGG